MKKGNRTRLPSPVLNQGDAGPPADAHTERRLTAVELGGEAPRPQPDRCRSAVAAVGAAFAAAAALPGWAPLGPWRFACAVTGASLLAANATSPYLIIGRRRFMPPRST